jgi:hypothetical protein
MNLYVQSVPRLVDEVVPIFDEQPQFVIRAPCVLTREIPVHSSPSPTGISIPTLESLGNTTPHF